MNTEMAYLLGMILGNGEIQRDNTKTRVTIDIPHKNLYTDDMKDVRVYVKASTVDIRSIVEPLIGNNLTVTQNKRSTLMTFVKANDEYTTREILRFIGGGRHHSTMRMNPDLFSITADEKKTLLRGIADVTGYIRKSNIAYGQDGAHRVYIEIPGNWYMVIDIANMLKFGCPKSMVHHQLAGLGPGAGPAAAVYHVVQPALQKDQEVVAGLAGHIGGHLIVMVELALQHAVETAGHLLGSQLHTILRGFLAALAVLPGGVGPP